MVCNQTTIADAISKEVERLEDINKLYTAGKTETETRSVNASKVGEKRIKDQIKAKSEIKQLKQFRGLRFTLRDRRQVTPNLQALYCLFFSPDCAHSVTMISHAIAVISKAVEYLNPGQTVVIACNQPLFALAKTIQWAQKDSAGRII